MLKLYCFETLYFGDFSRGVGGGGGALDPPMTFTFWFFSVQTWQCCCSFQVFRLYTARNTFMGAFRFANTMLIFCLKQWFYNKVCSHQETTLSSSYAKGWNF